MRGQKPAFRERLRGNAWAPNARTPPCAAEREVQRAGRLPVWWAGAWHAAADEARRSIERRACSQPPRAGARSMLAGSVGYEFARQERDGCAAVESAAFDFA